MSIPLSVDQRALEVADEGGKRVDQIAREQLEQQRMQFEERCLQSKAKLTGWQFNRDEANER